VGVNPSPTTPKLKYNPVPQKPIPSGIRIIKECDEDKPKECNNLKKIIKCGSHCYDGSGWKQCEFWKTTLLNKDGVHITQCSLFDNAAKYASESLIICNKIYGETYEGKP